VRSESSCTVSNRACELETSPLEFGARIFAAGQEQTINLEIINVCAILFQKKSCGTWTHNKREMCLGGVNADPTSEATQRRECSNFMVRDRHEGAE
jgi:hypothetical protein